MFPIPEVSTHTESREWPFPTGGRQKVTRSSLRSALCRTAGEIDPLTTVNLYPGKLGGRKVYVTGQESRTDRIFCMQLLSHSVRAAGTGRALPSAALYWVHRLQVQSNFLVQVAAMRCTMRACLAVQVLLAALIPQSMAQSESGLPCKLRRIHASPSCNYACFNSVFSQSRLAYIP